MSGQPPGSLTQEIQIQVAWGRAQTWAIFLEFPGNLSMQSELIAIDPTAYLEDSKHLSHAQRDLEIFQLIGCSVS